MSTFFRTRQGQRLPKNKDLIIKKIEERGDLIILFRISGKYKIYKLNTSVKEKLVLLTPK